MLPKEYLGALQPITHLEYAGLPVAVAAAKTAVILELRPIKSLAVEMLPDMPRYAGRLDVHHLLAPPVHSRRYAEVVVLIPGEQVEQPFVERLRQQGNYSFKIAGRLVGPDMCHLLECRGCSWYGTQRR